MMKKTIYILIVTFIQLSFSSCLNEVDDIFSDSAMNRLNKAKKEYREILEGAPNGWVMQYFPTPESNGFNLLTNFTKSGETTVACWTYLTQSQSYEEATSTFDVVLDYGPVLSYDTYNDVMHMFSDPSIRPLGTGFGGDYEFQLISATEDEIVLRGKKTGTPIRMFKCPENITWEEYLGNLDALDKVLFSTDTQVLLFKTDKATYQVTGGKNHIFVMRKTDPIDDSLPIVMPFIITETGVRLVYPFDIDGYTIQNFDLNEDRSCLVSREHPTLQFTGPSLEIYFYNTRTTWNLDRELMSNEAQIKYDRFVEYCKNYAPFKASKVSAAIERVDKGFVLKYTLMKGNQRLVLDLEMSVQSEDENQVNFSFSGAGNVNGAAFYKNSEELRDFLSIISGTINLSTDNGLNPSIIKFTNEKDSNHWIYLSENAK